MIVTGSISKVRGVISKLKPRKRIGFVPTMGCLHLGHLSLVRRSKRECDFTVVSIFVNPLQFGPREDYTRYPRDFKKDRKLLIKEGVDLVFYPSSRTIYSKDSSSYVEEAFLSRVLCGASRPGHFKGVCTVVAKLFNIIQPNTAYFGQKDYQQAQVVKRFVRDLNFPLKINVLPIVRENDGLAMSSRNTYLNKSQRKDAVLLYRALLLAKDAVRNGTKSSKKLKTIIKKKLSLGKTLKIDYISIVDSKSLRPVKKIEGDILLALAVYAGKTRLIDNILLRQSKLYI